MIVRRVEPRATLKRVAAYARVSTLDEQQEESYETQLMYYSELILATPGWQMANVYADRGITGTSAEKRSQFMTMIDDARKGKIDIILCKSISRFSRNVVETLKYVHELKSLNVEVRFEKEGISSFDASSDMIFNMMAAIAQEESRSISENVKWSYGRKAEQGIRHVGSNHMLGYDEVNGKLTPNEDAWIIKLIFEQYAAGQTIVEIIRSLESKGAKRKRSDRPFNRPALFAILNNEAYVGDRCIQKTPPQNYLTKKPDPTVAYETRYIHNDHEGIVSRETWNAAQYRLKREKEERAHGVYRQAGTHFMYGKVFCECCGKPYRRYTTKNHTEQFKVWRCVGRVKDRKCSNRHIRETELMVAISEQLGWNPEEEFDVWVFGELVDRVMVSGDAVKVVLADENGRESA